MNIRNNINHAIMINFYDEANKIITEWYFKSHSGKKMERYWVSANLLPRNNNHYERQ